MPIASRLVRVATLLPLFACVSWQTASAEVVAQKTISYFDINGNTADDLDKALNARGPAAMGASSHHPGATRIRFGGHATYVESNGRCHIGDVKVTVDTEIILPRWKDRRKAAPPLPAVWDRLSADIRRHEEHHAEIAKAHAYQMEKAIMALPPERTCDQLQEKVSAVSERAIALHDVDQERFDRTEAENFRNRMHRPAKPREP